MATESTAVGRAGLNSMYVHGEGALQREPGAKSLVRWAIMNNLAPSMLACVVVNSSCGRLILRKISTKMVPRTRFHILRLKCTKFAFHWGWAPDLAGGELTSYSASPDPRLAVWAYF